MAAQIDLAKKQIAQQDKAIDLATKDFDATLTALGITKQQAELADAERAKQPELRLFVNVLTKPEISYDPYGRIVAACPLCYQFGMWTP
jgi:hypothetical protein